MLTFKYNPQNATAEELRATFIAREEILAQMLTDLKETARGKSNQHFLVIGPRGIGKTNFLMMIYFSVKEDAALSSQYLPLKFAEEEYSIVSLRDLFEEALEVLAEETRREDLREYVEKVREQAGDEKGAEKAIQCLKDLARKEGKILLLLVDNIDLILGKQIKKQVEIKRLRDILMNQSFLTIVGAAPTYFQEVSSYSRPLYNLFKVLNLAELTEVQMQDFIRKRAEYDENKHLLERLPKESHKLKALHHLTGGNHRMVLTLYQILALSEFSDVKEYLVRLLDDLSPYYKGKLEWLSPQQRKIVDTMAKMDGAVSPTEIASRARLGINVVNTNLKRLLDWGYVKLAEQERRKTRYYIISERIFRIWHQMRYSRSSRKKIQFFVDFLQIWYTLEELKGEAERLVKTFEQCMECKELSRAKSIIEHLDYISAASTESAFRDTITDAEIQMLFDLSDLAGVRGKLEEKIKSNTEARNDRELAKALHGMGVLHAQMGEHCKALEYFDKALQKEPNSDEVWSNRGAALAVLGRYEDAIRSCDEALKIKPDRHEAWYIRGNALAGFQRYEEAVNSYDEALKIKPDRHEAWYNRGNALAGLQRYEEAVNSYDEALRVEPDKHEAWLNRGNAMAELGRHEMAIENYDRALKAKPDSEEAWYNRGIALVDLHRDEEAIKSYDEALRIKPDKHEAWYNRGTALARLERYEEAINSYDKALAINQDKREPWGNRGNALAALKRYEEAIKSYDEVLRIKPDDHLAWYNRGNAQVGLQRYEEAIRSYDEALKIKPKEHGAWHNRGNALFLSGQSQEAIGSLLRAWNCSTDEREIEATAMLLVVAYMVVSLKNVREGNNADALGAFNSALGYYSRITAEETKKTAGQLIVGYFKVAVSKARVGLFKDVIAALNHAGARDELLLLEPFIIANHYWESGEDREVLDRLNPEVREIVEKIIKEADERDQKQKSKPDK